MASTWTRTTAVLPDAPDPLDECEFCGGPGQFDGHLGEKPMRMCVDCAYWSDGNLDNHEDFYRAAVIVDDYDAEVPR